MNLFDVYPLIPVTIDRAEGCQLWDDRGQEYLDLYGGHAVISIGHTHPHYVKRIKDQLDKIAFYSNSVEIPIQQELAKNLATSPVCMTISFFWSTQGQKPMKTPLKWPLLPQVNQVSSRFQELSMAELPALWL